MFSYEKYRKIEQIENETNSQKNNKLKKQLKRMENETGVKCKKESYYKKEYDQKGTRTKNVTKN